MSSIAMSLSAPGESRAANKGPFAIVGLGTVAAAVIANLLVYVIGSTLVDVNRDTLWPILGEYGMRPIGQVSVDEVWSAMRFRPTREGEQPFAGGR